MNSQQPSPSRPSQRSEVSRFHDRLHALRAQGRRPRRRETASRERLREIIRSLEAVRSVEELVSGLSFDLAQVLGLRVEWTRRFFDGRYLLGMTVRETAQDHAVMQDRYTRVAVLVSPRSGAGRLEVECRGTVHDRDLPTTAWEDGMDADGMQRIAAFLEEQFLAFAARYCESRESLRLHDMYDLSWAEAALAAA